jgi:hypothetical protein
MRHQREMVVKQTVFDSLTMGAILGATLSVALLVLNSGQLFKMISAGAEPVVTAVIFVGAVVSTFGIGAGLSGLLFLMCARD